MVRRKVPHLDSEGLYNWVLCALAAEPIPLGRRAARKEDLESVAGALIGFQVVGPTEASGGWLDLGGGGGWFCGAFEDQRRRGGGTRSKPPRIGQIVCARGFSKGI